MVCRQHDADNDKILKWLSAPDPSTNLNIARKLHQPGTGQWFLDNNKYQCWKKDPASFLWLHGIPGCGKTVLSSTVISNLASDALTSPYLLYFYFNFTDVEKRSTENAVRSLIDQLYRKSADTRGLVESLYDTYKKSGSQPTYASLESALQTMIEQFPDIWIVLDGLDECVTRDVHASDNVISWTQNLRSQPNVHLLITSRPEDDIKSSIEAWSNAEEIIPLQSSLVVDDISTYIRTKVERMDRWRTSPDIQEDITTALQERAGGM